MERPFRELATEAKYQHTPFGGRRQIAPRTRTEANATEQTTERPSDRATERPSDRATERPRQSPSSLAGRLAFLGALAVDVEPHGRAHTLFIDAAGNARVERGIQSSANDGCRMIFLDAGLASEAIDNVDLLALSDVR